MGEFRDAEPGDAEAIAALHAESWRAHYRGILPDAYLDGEVFAERQAFWRDALRAPRAAGQLVLVATRLAALAGFVAIVRDREPGFGAEIENLHVRPRLCGRGLGRRLLGEAVGRLAAAGVSSACLWVYDANEAAIRFYRRLGGMTDKHGFDDFAGAHAPHTRIVWPDLAVLQHACRG
jgi:ribosomal protein S18 acetylase RimI-like enzyme